MQSLMFPSISLFFVFEIVQRIMHPAQGFFNFCVYIRPRWKKVQLDDLEGINKCPTRCWFRFRRALRSDFRRGSTNLTRVRNAEDELLSCMMAEDHTQSDTENQLDVIADVR